MVWLRLHYLMGFQKLGHEVCFVEEIDPDWCVDEQGQQSEFQQSINRSLFRSTMERFGLMERACQIYNGGEATSGLSVESLIKFARGTDLLVNVSGHVKSNFILSNVKRRLYLDEDPVWTQLWNGEYGVDLNFSAHDVFFTVGLNIGTPHTSLPDCSIKWHHTLPPVVLDYWPAQIDVSCKRFTTIASLRAFGELCYQGEWYGHKFEELERFAKLPSLVEQEFEIAVKYLRAEKPGLALLKDHGWLFSDSSKIADLSSYQDYIARSRAEIGIAQSAYVKSRSGWFSDRWSDYLGRGRPVLAQATGFERHLPTGRGILAFGNMEEAVAGVEEINRDYIWHCRAAREFAEEYLDYRKVLPRLLDA
jgi:hypothetical protein